MVPEAVPAERSSSFLTPDQRAALDAALVLKERENVGKALEAQAICHAKAGHGDRKPRNKAMWAGGGGPKKAGGGGKWTWGSILTNGDKAEGAIDKHDPNYDSDDERAISFTQQHQQLKTEVAVYKQEVQEVVAEYFSSGDIADTAESLEDLGMPACMHYFVKRLITCALDRKDREREMTSVLLSSLYANVIPPEQVQKGFGSLIESIGDLVLDVPSAPDLLALFLARAVADDVLPPAFALRIPNSPAPFAALRHKLESEMTGVGATERALRCWGSGAGLTYQDTKASLTQLLADYLAGSRDCEEAEKSLGRLGVGYFHHELVKQAIHKAMALVESQPSQAQALVQLLLKLGESGQVTSTQLHCGLERVASTLDDLTLDNPRAQEQYEAVMELVRAAGLLQLGDDAALTAARRQASACLAPSAAALAAGVHSVAGFKAAAVVTIREYFDSADMGEVARRLQEVDQPGLLPLFVKALVVAALDRRSRERELTSQLLKNLHPEFLDSDIAAAGFTKLLGAADDLVLDCPDAVHLLSLFVVRAVVDGVLPPAFLTQVLGGLHPASLGVAVVKAAGVALGAKGGTERAATAWKGGSLSLDQVRNEMRALVAEYVQGSHDVGEAGRCLLELGVPAYHHEAVVLAMEAAYARQGKAGEEVGTLLAALSQQGLISADQMTKGFARMKASLSEEVLDYGPGALKVFEELSARAAREGWLVA
eukprot:CAMPEP_0119109296 /NCGR_PEP_ID=MMETSP1180-20130426/17833_1 /TAXON_ID=3052 ORGANISM="Chlamydomonas cf sp, Strain CCMP681" /NCGR_SAMPLE_ID=MMETSP1180 /ASSEMBLY_ACC=CAM_ASM_000741 /LENGTH=712 /DNA_ID=CAMNT_0007095037 /DNA_START=104 /DNA_END=2242 /DNA_ORIENTATION=-